MANTDPFYHECYEILTLEKPSIAFQIAELIAAGRTPHQVRDSIANSAHNISTTLPSLAENAAHYLRGVVVFVPGNSNQLRH